jgi:uncharacterized membrane protein YccC
MSGTTTLWTARVGFVSAAAVLAAVLAAIALGLADPWWAAISAWRVADSNAATALVRGFQRVVGTLAGVVFGIFVAGLFVAQPVAMGLLIFACGAVCTWYRFASSRWGYAWVMAGVTTMLVLAQAVTDAHGLFPFAIARVEEILCGVVVASAVVILLGGQGAGNLTGTAPAVPQTEGLGRVALLGGSVVLGVVVIWTIFDLPTLPQMVVGAVVVIDRDIIALRKKGGQRLFGCLLGGLYGLVLAGIGLDSLVLWMTAVGAGIFLFSRSAMGGGPNAYVGFQGGLAVLTTLIAGDGPPSTVVPILERFLGNAVVIALLVVLSFVWAGREKPVNRA